MTGWYMVGYSALVAVAVSSTLEFVVWPKLRKRKAKEVPDGAVHAEAESGASDVG